LIQADAREWLIDFGFSMVTLLGFAAPPLLAEPAHSHRYVHRVVKIERARFIELDIVVGPNFTLQTIAEQDRLRERIWRSIGMPLHEAWLAICLTGDSIWV